MRTDKRNLGLKRRGNRKGKFLKAAEYVFSFHEADSTGFVLLQVQS